MSTTADTSLLPWIGKDYSAGFRGKHILVLGESFYCDDCDPCILAPDSECRQMPRKTVDDYLLQERRGGVPAVDENLYRIRAGGVWARDDRRGMFGVLERRDIRQLRANARSRLPHGPHGRTVGAGCPRLFPAPE